jgi:hypothetical protein
MTAPYKIGMPAPDPGWHIRPTTPEAMAALHADAQAIAFAVLAALARMNGAP